MPGLPPATALAIRPDEGLSQAADKFAEILPRFARDRDRSVWGIQEAAVVGELPNSHADVLASVAGPGDSEFELHLWLALDTCTIVRVRRLDDTTTVVVYDIAHLQEPEREEVVAALVRALDEFRDNCQGFVLDRTGRSSRDAWDSLILERAWPSEPFPDSVAVDAGLGALPSGSGAVTRAEYGHLAVFNRNRVDGAQA